MPTIEELLQTIPQVGTVDWIGLRPARNAPMESVGMALAEVGTGLRGDRYSRLSGPRQVTLVQAEHLDAIASMLHLAALEPGRLRRNLVVRGLNLLALKGRRFQIGAAQFKYTGPCHPCSKMERELGPGGYNAMRGHGGITASVIEAGEISIGASVIPL